MRGVTKKFDQALFDKSDPAARQKVTSFLNRCGFQVRENSNKYGVDLVASKDGTEVYVEVERRGAKNWPGGKFRFSTVHVPGRKEKYLGKKFAYAALSHDMNQLAWLSSEKVQMYFKEELTTEVPNCYVAYGERFFDIPTSEWQFIDLSILENR